MNNQVKESDFQMNEVVLKLSEVGDGGMVKRIVQQVNPMNKLVQFKVDAWNFEDDLGESYHSTLQSAIEAYNQL